METGLTSGTFAHGFACRTGVGVEADGEGGTDTFFDDSPPSIDGSFDLTQTYILQMGHYCT